MIARSIFSNSQIKSTKKAELSKVQLDCPHVTVGYNRMIIYDHEHRLLSSHRGEVIISNIE